MTERVSMGDVQNHSPSRPSNDHARHDRPLVTRFAAQDAYPTEVDEAQALVQRCAECAALAADIRALMKATAQLPPIPRPRDFRLTAEQAEQLRGSAFERFLRRLAAPRLSVLRPVAGVAMAFGLLMAVIGAAGQPMAMPASLDTFDARQAEGTEMPAMAPLEEPGPEIAAGGEDPGEPASVADDGERELMYEAQVPAADPNSLLLYVGLLLAVTSGGALMLLWFARRESRDPLLR